MTRAVVLTFLGRYRGDSATWDHVHESPWVMLGPLVILAIGSIVGGYIDIPHFVAPALRMEAAHEGHARLAAGRGLADRRRPASPSPTTSTSLFPDIPGRIYASARGLARILENKYGFDAVYDRFASRVVVGGERGSALEGRRRTRDRRRGERRRVGGRRHRPRRPPGPGRDWCAAYALLILGGAVSLLGYLLWLR